MVHNTIIRVDVKVLPRGVVLIFRYSLTKTRYDSFGAGTLPEKDSQANTRASLDVSIWRY